jgi:hypothetical protein
VPSPSESPDFPGCASDYSKRNVLNSLAKNRGAKIPFPFAPTEKLYEAYLEPPVPIDDKFVDDYARAFMNVHVVQFRRGSPLEIRYGRGIGGRDLQFQLCAYRLESPQPSGLVPIDPYFSTAQDLEWGWKHVRTSPLPGKAADYNSDKTVVAFFATPGLDVTAKAPYRIRARQVPAK